MYLVSEFAKSIFIKLKSEEVRQIGLSYFKEVLLQTIEIWLGIFSESWDALTKALGKGYRRVLESTGLIP
jgi:hypothetical protein